MAKYEEWLKEDCLTLLKGWARNGLTEKQLAHNMGISITTLKDWKSRFPAISAAIKKGKEVVDLEVENALLKSALSGNTTAQIFWLKNRQPDRWRERPENRENTGEGETGVILLQPINENLLKRPERGKKNG